MKYLKNIILLFALTLIVGCGGGSSSSSSSDAIATYSANSVKNFIQKNVHINSDIVYGYKAYKIVYKTIDDSGNSVDASGVMVVPTLDGVNEKSNDKLTILKNRGLSIVVNCHGTIFSNNEAPSVAIANGTNPDGIGVLFSSIKGFVTLIPDYIGFGSSSKHYHPYLLKKSSANSVKDFINAAISFANSKGIELSPSRDVYLTGYSEGGYVAMSAINTIEKEPISLKLAMPMAGPYLIEPIGSAIVKTKKISQPSYAANVVYSYAKAYNKSLQSIFKEPYKAQIGELLSGKYSKSEIDSKLTTNTQELFTQEFLNNYSTSWFRVKLISNSAVSFTKSPFVKIKMLHCKGDNVVPYKVATNTKKILQFNGANVELITVENTIKSKNLGHLECAMPSYKITAETFEKLRDN